MLYQQCFLFFLQLFNHYSALKNRWGLYRLESKQKNKCEMGRQPHCELQTCTPGVNYILMESCMHAACLHKHSHHFGGIKYMHMHNKRHEGMRPYALLGKCKLANMLSVCGDQPVTALASLQLCISGVKQVLPNSTVSQLPPFLLSLNYPSYVSTFFFSTLSVFCTKDN